MIDNIYYMYMYKTHMNMICTKHTGIYLYI